MTFKIALRLPIEWWFFTILMLLLWISTPEIVEHLFHRDREKGSGAFGDTFGFITSGFSILTTMLVVAGLIFQREEIHQLQAALKQQGDEFENQNSLTRQQMAFHEIQTRIEAQPFFVAELDYFAGSDDFSPPLNTTYNITLKNKGAPVYNVRVHFEGIYEGFMGMPPRTEDIAVEARLDTGGSIVAIEEVKRDDFDNVRWNITYVTNLGEAAGVYFEMQARIKNIIYTKFDKDAQAIRRDVTKRMKVSLEPVATS